MTEKAVAMLYEKHNFGMDYYFFSPVHNILGKYDYETNTFNTVDENTYFGALDVVDKKNENFAFISPLNYKELKQKYPNMSVKDCISMFDAESRENIFVIKDTKKAKQVLKISLPTLLKDRNRTVEFSKDELIRIRKSLTTIKDDKIERELELKDIFLPKDENDMNIKDAYKYITSIVMSQDEHVKRLLTEIYRMELSSTRNGILLTGSTGVGKTKIMSLLAKKLNRPLKIVDTTQITMPGYVGVDIEEVLYNLYEECGKDKEKAEKAIIYFDEIDKKGSSSKSDVSGQGVLNVLLKFLDGTTYQAKANKTAGSIPINTSKMLIVAGGAFLDVYNKEANKQKIGFNSNSDNDKDISIEDFIEKAMMPREFMGRFPISIHLNDLSVNDIEKILTSSLESPFLIEQEVFKKNNVSLKATEEYFKKTASLAYDKGTGARGLVGIVKESTWQAFNYTLENSCSSITLTKDTLEDGNNFIVDEKVLKLK